MDRESTLALVVVGLALMAAVRYSQGEEGGDEDQTASIFDRLPSLSDLFYMTQDAMNGISNAQAQANIAAFLATIRYAEGTQSEEGYRALFGWRPGSYGRTFDSFADHPRILFPYTNLAGQTIQTSAAGAYQITRTTYDKLQEKYPELQGRGFSAQAQDDMALLLIAERGALGDVQAGRLDSAINKVRGVWASLPGSNVNQPTRSYTALAQVFEQNGGVLV